MMDCQRQNTKMKASMATPVRSNIHGRRRSTDGIDGVLANGCRHDSARISARFFTETAKRLKWGSLDGNHNGRIRDIDCPELRYISIKSAYKREPFACGCR